VIPITDATVSVFTVPTDGPESDGTLEWTSTTMVVTEMLFDGLPELSNGMMRPDLSRAGFGLELKRADASRYAAA
jgi:hypothetical protein